MNEGDPTVDARLLFICFYSENRESAKCLQSEQEWLPLIKEMNEWLGVDKSCELTKRVHYLFLPVNPIGSRERLKSSSGIYSAAPPLKLVLEE